MLQGEHSAILTTFIKLPFVIKIFVLSIFEWPLKTGFTVSDKYQSHQMDLMHVSLCLWSHQQFRSYGDGSQLSLIQQTCETRDRTCNLWFTRQVGLSTTPQLVFVVNCFCCFMSQVNSYGHGGMVSSPNHTFPWASLNKQLTSTSCTYFHL